MPERHQLAEHAGIADEHVEPAPALVDRGAEAVDGVVVAQVEGDEGGRAARRPHGIVEILEGALRAGDRDHVGAGRGQRQGRRAADAARGPGDDRDAVGEGFWGEEGVGHRVSGPWAQSASARIAIRRGEATARSVSAVG